jgi:hypothetical protein
MTKVRDWLRGKKTYITAAIGVLGALIAWADGSIDLVALGGALWAAVSACTVRAGIDTAARSGRTPQE